MAWFRALDRLKLGFGNQTSREVEEEEDEMPVLIACDYKEDGDDLPPLVKDSSDSESEGGMNVGCMSSTEAAWYHTQTPGALELEFFKMAHAYAATTNSPSLLTESVANSGASQHMVCNFWDFINYVPLAKPVKIMGAFTGAGLGIG